MTTEDNNTLSFDFKKFVALFRKPVSKPTYVLNLINYKNFASYRIYGLLILPMILLSGGGVTWAGRHIQNIYGEPICKNVFFVRYQSHRFFMLFIANPYMLLVNRFRDRGVEKFEAAFSRTIREEKARKIDAAFVLGIHFNSDDENPILDSNRALLESFQAREILAIKERYIMDFLTNPKPNEPNPHTYKVNQFFALEDKELPDELDRKVISLAKGLNQCSVQLYKKANQKHYLPFTPIPEYYK